MTHLTVDGVTKIFGDPDKDGVVAVDDLDIDVEDGEFLVLLGPSGCGKTTTLRMIGGLETPTSGEIRFDDVVVNDIKARNRDVAMVFQDFALYPHMTVRENLGFGLKREDNGMSTADVNERVEEVATMLEIEQLLNNKPAQLSGGQKQRVALGRAIIREPRLFLFDEPLANLDAKLRKTMRTEIDELQSEVGITSAYVTHNQEEAMTIADKIAVLNDGALQQLGRPEEVFNEPANLFVAQFVGSPDMNIYDGVVEEAADGVRVELDGVSFELPSDALDAEVPPGGVNVGFRPQDFYQTGKRRADGLTFDVDIRVIEPVGTKAIVHGDGPMGDVTAEIGEFHGLSAGDTLSLSIAPEHVYLFEAETEALRKGRRIENRASVQSQSQSSESDGVEI
ncbi:ABC transporter ATP-binding protein [Haloferax volcanii]|uniref:ABC-type D-xylose/L-arabinose transporter n=3 Tax=Haloferax volcanii TaxID=2246 RepID=D4GPB1_HALVD|nr:ATP-binding cassette domain-containing protein [Haloferax volcanii]ADE01472.1 ABC-type transport system ATP-binding protein (substrate L-rhamnose) [Haloferax volcanii DS2]ELY36723.1 sugar ABC transporter ATP-binding protein [Haloferax volcanii DS2]MBS8118191.1 ATP-binding cassette domain-containing protein [Haloferax volcanii]MBS8123203.1 ATP-binding cassette domain-containing protein [Haloferax volcanii]MBS8127071.1 ATP-binding cassette domain-containing protein [Haloferax volcanii]